MSGNSCGGVTFAPGTAVRLHGLVNHPRYNSHVGRVASLETDSLGRLEVNLTAA